MRNIKMLIFLMVLSTLCVLLLTGANILYQKASAVFNVRLYAVILDLFKIPVRVQSANEKPTGDEIKNVFLNNFEIKNVGGKTYYIAKKKDRGVIAFKTSGPGLWSTIEILLAVYPNFEKLYGLRVISQAETPGLGGRIAERAFQKRFTDVELTPTLRIVKFASAPNEVDAITGASKTSKALEVIINRAIKEVKHAFKEVANPKEERGGREK